MCCNKNLTFIGIRQKLLCHFKAGKIFNPVFDSTPSKYIDGIITEIGLISPGSVYHVMTSQLGDDIFKFIGD